MSDPQEHGAPDADEVLPVLSEDALDDVSGGGHELILNLGLSSPDVSYTIEP